MAMMKLKVIANYNGYTKVEYVVVPLQHTLIDIKSNLELKFKTKNLVIKSC